MEQCHRQGTINKHDTIGHCHVEWILLQVFPRVSCIIYDRVNRALPRPAILSRLWTAGRITMTKPDFYFGKRVTIRAVLSFGGPRKRYLAGPRHVVPPRLSVDTVPSNRRVARSGQGPLRARSPIQRKE
ncbi:hypothetical protein J6590_055748 [Homalodisca vitripennis]|nr:hypothetical protein J6590_055748 [Homalodisca vitripennis]